MDKVAVILVAVFAAVVRAEISAVVELSRDQADIGDDLKVTCMITNTGKKQFFIKWIRKVGDKKVQIGVNKHIEEQFKQTKRYSAAFEQEQSDSFKKVTFFLNIKNVQASDSGEIGCEVPEHHLLVLENFEVKVPLESVKLSSQFMNGTHAVSYGQGVNATFNEGEQRRFFCHVNGSYPAPVVSVMLGDDDITDRFNKTQKLVGADKVEEVSTDGTLPSLYYSVTMSNNALHIDYDYSHKALMCVATIPNTDLESKNTSINIQLTGYKPKFQCERNMAAGLHQVEFNITCVVHSEPPVNEGKFFWEDEGHVNKSLEPGKTENHYFAQILSGKSDRETIMVLSIDRIHAQHFRKYYFEAINDLGPEVHEIQLVRDHSLDPTTQGAIIKPGDQGDQDMKPESSIGGGMSLAAGSVTLMMVGLQYLLQ